MLGLVRKPPVFDQRHCAARPQRNCMLPCRAQAPQKSPLARPVSDVPMVSTDGGISIESASVLDAFPHHSFARLVSDQVMDTLGDMARHVSRSISARPDHIAADRLVICEEDMACNVGQHVMGRTSKPILCILGSGWGAHSCMKVIDTDAWDVVLVSPRNHFVFTPMLPSSAVGTVEFRSLLEPVRTSNEFVTYFEAACDSIDLTQKLVACTSALEDSEGKKPTFQIPYDVLLVAVGEQPATFGVPGVEEHTFFLKEITDTVRLRKRIVQCFELACLPTATEQDRKQLLNFVVVGGGPAGVEFAGTLSDFVRNDARAKYPKLMKYVNVVLLQAIDTILPQFDKELAARALEELRREGIDVRVSTQVMRVTAKQVHLKDGSALDFGLCVWSAGNASRPLVHQLVEAIPTQRALQPKAGPKNCKLMVDHFLRVAGASDVMALGDCSRVLGDPLPPTAQVAGQQGVYLAHMLNGMFAVGEGGAGLAPPVRPKPRPLKALRDGIQGAFGLRPKPGVPAPVNRHKYDDLKHQVADPSTELESFTKPFEWLNLGIMAYIGDEKALAQIEAGRNADISLNLWGSAAFFVWRAVYVAKQVSLRNRVLILLDWMKAKAFGREMSLF